MSTPLLATKFYLPPPAPTLVHRADLCARLSAGLHRKLVLISAPAGFGKTTLVSEWLRGMERPVAWLALDEEESDVNRFLAYLIGALQRVQPAFGTEVLASLSFAQPPPLETILTTLLNEIATDLAPSILVLDDYHLVEAQAVDSTLTFLLDHLPPQLLLVITTREDPNLPLARLRARGQLTEIRANDLRFTADEATAFFNQKMGLNLAIDDVEALDRRTEGWIAGLHLAAVSLQGHPHTGADGRSIDDRKSFVQSFTGSHRFVMDYLVEEVLEQQPAQIQRFLLYTSILNRFCAPLCDALLRDRAMAGQTTLTTLEQSNLFLVPLDNERRWYRYHHLFADLLRQRLTQHLANLDTAALADDLASDSDTMTPVEAHLAQYHHRASIWFEEEGLASEALHHALRAKAFSRAAGLLEQVWRSMDDNRQAARWQRWVQQLPEEILSARPVLSAAYGWALLDSGELEQGDHHLRIAETFLQPCESSSGGSSSDAVSPDTSVSTPEVTNEAEFQALPATIAAARTYHALATGDLAGTKIYAQRALQLLPVDHHLRRGVPGALLGLAYWADDELALACQTFADAMASFHKAGNLLFALTGSYILANMKRAQGRLREAKQIHEQWLRLAVDQGALVQRGAADIYTGLGELACEQGDLESASTYLQQSEALGAQSPLPRWRYRWSLAQSHLCQARGELDAAWALLEEAEQFYVRGPVPDVASVAAMKARLLIQQGRLAEATAWARDVPLPSDGPLAYLREFDYITLARLRIAQYRQTQERATIVEATTLLMRLYDVAQRGQRTGSMIELLMLLALAQEAHGELATARETLAETLRLAAPEGYVQLFVSEGEPFARLLAAVTAPIPSDYLATLQSALGMAMMGEGRHTNKTPTISMATTIPSHPVSAEQPLIEPLSERELEVLHLIAQGYSNREISEQLFLALSTVKGHNRNIFGKLQVQRRTEAVARARELGLL